MQPDGFASPEANDIRFQYDVIRNLAESVREQSKVMASIQTTQVSMLERLAKIEANRVNEVVAEVKALVAVHEGKIDKLEQDRDIREGGAGARRAVQSYWSIITTLIGVIGTVLFLILRTIGIIHLPSDDQKPPVIVPVQVQPRETVGRP